MDRMTADISQLVNRCRRGEQDAFAPLVQRFQNAGYAIALGMVRDPHDVEDVLQDAFIAAYCKLGQLREPAAFPGWFRSIVVAQCREWLRQRSTRQRYADQLSTSAEVRRVTSPGQQEDGLAQRRLWEHVFTLPEPARSAALLFYLSGFSQRETAAFLQVPPSTVNGRLQQARQHLRRTLTPDELEDVAMSKIDVSAEVARVTWIWTSAAWTWSWRA
jgi:RNA polymerase sigma factor (sigma-70 family)